MAKDYYAEINHVVSIRFDESQISKVSETGKEIDKSITSAMKKYTKTITGGKKEKEELGGFKESQKTISKLGSLTDLEIRSKNTEAYIEKISQLETAEKKYGKTLEEEKIRVQDIVNSDKKRLEDMRSMSAGMLGLNMSMLSFTFGAMNLEKVINMSSNDELFYLNIKKRHSRADEERIRQIRIEIHERQKLFQILQGGISITQMFLTIGTLYTQYLMRKKKAQYEIDLQTLNNIKLEEKKNKDRLKTISEEKMELILLRQHIASMKQANALSAKENILLFDKAEVINNVALARNRDVAEIEKEVSSYPSVAGGIIDENALRLNTINTKKREIVATKSLITAKNEETIVTGGNITAQSGETTVRALNTVATNTNTLSIWARIGAKITELSVSSLGTLIPQILGAVMTGFMVYEMAKSFFPTNFATGGIVYPRGGGQIIVAGDNGVPERITPLTARDKTSGEGGNTTIVINAVDYKSFVNMLKNGQASILRDMI